MKNIRHLLVLVVLAMTSVQCSEDLESNSTPTASKTILFAEATTSFVAQIGQLPASLKGQISTSDNLKPVSAADYDRPLSPKAAMLFINSDAVNMKDFNALADGAMVASAMKLNIPIVFGADTELGTQNELIQRLGGAFFPDNHFTMLRTEGPDASTLVVIPIGGTGVNHMPENELAMMINGYLQTEDAGVEPAPLPVANTVMSAEGTASSCDHYNIIPLPRINNGYGTFYYIVPGRDRSSYPSVDRYSRTWIGQKILGEQELVTDVKAGQGQITFREVTITTTTKTFTRSWNWKVEVSTEILGTLSLSAWYSQERSSSVTVSDQYSSGGTIYSAPCVYACCDVQAVHRTLINIWHDKVRVVGSSTQRYYRKDHPTAPYDVTKTYCYTAHNSKNPLKFERDGVDGTPFVGLVFVKKDKNCNNNSCTAGQVIKSGANKGKRPCEIGSIGK